MSLNIVNSFVRKKVYLLTTYYLLTMTSLSWVMLSMIFDHIYQSNDHETKRVNNAVLFTNGYFLRL